MILYYIKVNIFPYYLPMTVHTLILLFTIIMSSLVLSCIKVSRYQQCCSQSYICIVNCNSLRHMYHGYLFNYYNKARHLSRINATLTNSRWLLALRSQPHCTPSAHYHPTFLGRRGNGESMLSGTYSCKHISKIQDFVITTIKLNNI